MQAQQKQTELVDEYLRKAAAQDPNLSRIVLEAAPAGENTLQRMKALADRSEDVAGRLTRMAEGRTPQPAAVRGSACSFISPFGGPAVLYLKKVE